MANIILKWNRVFEGFLKQKLVLKILNFWLIYHYNFYPNRYRTHVFTLCLGEQQKSPLIYTRGACTSLKSVGRPGLLAVFAHHARVDGFEDRVEVGAGFFVRGFNFLVGEDRFAEIHEGWPGTTVVEAEIVVHVHVAVEVSSVVVPHHDLIALVAEAVLECLDYVVGDAVPVEVEGLADDHLHRVLLERNALAAQDAADLADERRADLADLLDVLLRALAERKVEGLDVVSRDGRVHVQVQAVRVRNDVPDDPRGQLFRHHHLPIGASGMAKMCKIKASIIMYHINYNVKYYLPI